VDCEKAIPRLGNNQITMNSFLLHSYQKVVIERPYIALSFVLLIVVFFALQTPNFRLDASAEALVLEHDEDLQYYRITREIYGSDDFLIVTYSPPQDLLSPTSLANLQTLRDELSQLERVTSVLTILDVPLLNSPKVSISQLTDSGEIRSLEMPGADKELARKEFQESPIYKNNFVSLDGRTTVLFVKFQRDETYFSLLNERNHLKDKDATTGLTTEERDRLSQVIKEFDDYRILYNERGSQDIQAVRGLMDKHKEQANMFLGGARMITADMISFIEHDIIIFGVGVAGFLILALSYFFASLRWVAIPMSCCLISVCVMVGYLGLLDWRVTVISSNFISILLIITMSLTIHLIVRYRILIEQHPQADQKTLVLDTMRIMAKPSFYTAITTIVAFGSLIVSDIRPVVDFGWMMTIGIAFAFVLNFIYFPAILTFLRPERVNPHADLTKRFTLNIAAFTVTHAKPIIVASVALALLGAMGISRLEVENRFIDHFKSTTEIYQGMELIDRELGGTIPLEFVLDAGEDAYASRQEFQESEELFDDPFAEEGESDEMNYWFNGDTLEKIEEIHDYLDQIPEIGKVLSVATGVKVFKQLNEGEMPEDYELALLRKHLPDNVKETLLDPYLAPDANHTRITMRLIESAPTLKRKALINQIKTYLVDEQNLSEEQVHPTGLAVLYNNLLQSLYTSQILTLGAVFIAILGMFAILFRNVSLSILAVIPNLLAAGLVLGLMGWLGIPLDLMTITIAAITIGIGVDDTIHYVHRFQVKFGTNPHYRETVKACHGSVGRAMYYTSLTITAGFSILALSSFIPTIYFGLLAGFAMLVALLSNLTLLPALLLLFKPLGPEGAQKPTPAM
jgi:predicted RND superfamily exporter protein